MKVKTGKKSRGKKHCRRWADKKEQGEILNLRRKINCDEQGRSLPDPKRRSEVES